MNYPKNLRSLLFLLVLLGVGLASCSKKREGEPKVLIFSKTAGFYHESIPNGIAAIQKLGAENGFSVDTTKNAELINEENLAQYAAVIFLSTTADVLNHYQEADFERYIQSGGGFVGIHAAADTEYEWGWYGRLVGGYFSDHPGINDPHPNVQPGKITKTGEKHPSVDFLPESWERTDEWYSYKNVNPNTKKLLLLDESSYQGGMDMGEHPIAWYHDFDGGRAWYTGGGHTKESYEESEFLSHLLAGINYAIGDNLELDYSKAKSKRVPEENRFIKTTLSIGEFTEPTEMTILPNLDILVAQRRGEILHYDQATGEMKEVAKFDVYWKAEVQGVNAEEGLMGLQKDPNYATNNWVYAYYAPAGDKEVNRLSRFKFANGVWDMSSEQIILEVYSQRNICCHTGGSITFDAEGNLFLSTGDNSTPFNQPNTPYKLNGYAPLDGREGNKQWDARRSSGNSNDLRGKILRIKVAEDGSYTIPEGNLYPQGTEGARPEIYTQGLRNPYRISVDQKNGFLYWGEVGPDASNDSLDVKGPRGYDEVNQARKAGHFGWPYTIGDNYSYREYNYETGELGQAFDPAGPENNSPNNTGLKKLPPVEPAFIWYPYGASPEFPQLGTGGRNAMAGPVYYSDMYPAETRMPDYFDGKLFIYDWIRGWIKVVTMQENGDFDKMEPFMPGTKFNALMDMEMGPDGKIYILEYGNGWFTKNPDAGLFRIDYNGGNRAPVVTELSSDKTSGKEPLTVTFTAKASDPEKDPMTYTWDLGNGETKTTNEPTLTHTFNSTGDFEVSVKASDPAGLSGTSIPVNVYSGNTAPEIQITVDGNQSFYFPGKKVSYTVAATDIDEPGAALDMGSLYVSADYVSGIDLAEADMGHKVMSEAMTGKSLVQSLTCKTCHKENEASIGPAYTEVAKKYRERDRNYLLDKIRKGGGGVWGETAMPANPDLKSADANALVTYILSLKSDAKPSLAAKGSLDATLGKSPSPTGALVISATYTDKGGENIKPLTGANSLVLTSNSPSLALASDFKGYNKMVFNGQTLLTIPGETGSFGFPATDLTGIGSVSMNLAIQGEITKPLTFEIRQDSPSGPVVGQGAVNPGKGMEVPGMPIPMFMTSIPVTGGQDGQKHKLFFVSDTQGSDLGTAIVIGVTFNAK
ncbi:ThuA domain-containing protein [Algoriphagus sanaruensis]|uniref:Crp/Fnr family transcriptional regulator n=1 Tax=Algoriphagus sanaruensis TaxID=1727163 RepID=A0A142ERM1_9BACT|nr:ThuA domain-containing protein [Algoriphagus sanaruensis]AMQ57776.1 Crp/Fnr family transcriptional regulator [Algoriphagus sanaruensis]